MVEQVVHCTTLGGTIHHRHWEFVFIITHIQQIKEKSIALINQNMTTYSDSSTYLRIHRSKRS